MLPWHRASERPLIPSQSRRRRGLPVRALLAGVLLTLLSFGIALAQNPLAVQIYFVPLAEDDALVAMKGTNSNATAPVFTYISISIGTNGTLVYYDHWENGFDADIANPSDLFGPGNPDGTQVWGNGIAADGCPPNRDGKTPLTCSNANDVLNSGNVVVLSNPVDPTTLQTVIDFDGGDKIGSTKQIAVTRLYWPQVPRTLLGGAIELQPTNKWGTSYISPVGEGDNLGVDPNNNEDGDYANMFEFTSLAIQAFQPATNVAVDTNGPAAGGIVIVTLGPGESVVVNNIVEAATVNSSLPVQVQLITADRNSSYEHSAYTLAPTSSWDSTLFSPVGVVYAGANPVRRTQMTFFNPSNDFLAVECKFRDGVSKTIVMSPLSSTALETPDRSGAECSAVTPPGQPFFAIATVDAAFIQGGAGETWDWGISLIPQSQMSPQALVGLGVGRDPTSSAAPTQNGSPVWVSPSCGISRLLNFVFVDFNGDGVPDRADLNGDGDTNDTVDGIPESTSNQGMSVGDLKSVRLFDPVDRDQTGALVSTRLLADYSSTAFGCDIGVVWGADPNVASTGEPGFDVGTSVPPLSSISSVKEGFLLEDRDGDGYVTRGDVLGYRIKVENTGIAPIATVLVSDSVPISTTYVPMSTTLDLGSGPVPVADDLPPRTPFPLDEGGLVLGTNMPPGAEWIVSYAIVINTQDPAPAACSEFVITNTAFVNGDEEVEEVPGFEPVECAGTLVVRKLALGGPPVPTFAFTATAEFFQGGPGQPLPNSGTLSPPAFGIDAVTYTVPTGVYTVTETLVPGWALTSIICEGSGAGNVVNRTATLLVLGDDLVRCTFVNTQESKLVIAKVTDPPGDPTRFFFDLGGTSGLPEEPEDPSVPIRPVPPIAFVPVLSDGEEVTYTVLTGQYFVTETVPAGWTLTDIGCTPAGNPGGVPNLPGNAATFNVTPGLVTKCTFTNTLNATIIVRKVTIPPGDPQQFTFTGALTGTIGHGEVLTASVLPGSYTVTESLPAGWRNEGIFCSDSDSSGQGNSATFVVDAGEVVTCTFTNLRLASVGDRAWDDLNANGLQDAGEPGFPGIQVQLFRLPAGPLAAGRADEVLVGTQNTNASGNYLFANLPPGSYALLFAIPAGYNVSPQNVGSDPASDSDIDATGRTADFDLAPGDSNLTLDAGYFRVPTSDPGTNEPGSPIYLPAVRK